MCRWTGGFGPRSPDGPAHTMLGTVTLIEKKRIGEVLLRYNFPGGGLSDEALRTLILMVLSTGADVRRALSE